MEENARISVRELVAFSYFSPDIIPAREASLMLKGTRAHQARQAKSEGESERVIRHMFACEEWNVQVYGRMDVLIDGDVPIIEEIKLGGERRSEPLAEHRAQAVCYAAMLSLEKPCDKVCVRVCYTDEHGQALQVFEETLSQTGLLDEIYALLRPYVRFLIRERSHRERRDESLRALTFPFEVYRRGQRELAVQVYTAIQRKKRLFASLPTGTGKSAAVLFPALKALGEGKTEKVLYLTACGTARQSPLNALARMREGGMHVRVCILTAKEKLCPETMRCSPENCSRASGHYVRQSEAIDAILASGELIWDERTILSWAERFRLCPFELALALTELADVVMMDLNYVFDPFAQIKRLFQRKGRCTLLVDEAHHAVDRVRDSLSGTLDSREITALRAAFGKRAGRKNALYRAAGDLLHALRALEYPEEEGLMDAAPAELGPLVQRVADAASQNAHFPEGLALLRLCLPYLYAMEHFDQQDDAVLLEKHGKERVLTLYCLLPGKEIQRVTRGMRGVVFFSATLNPLPAMKLLLGGDEEDACFSLPSPFPANHLAVIRRALCTRYEAREQTAQAVADAITEMVLRRRGNYIAYFPSYAYLNMVRNCLPEKMLPSLWVQTREMEEADRAAFLEAFEHTDEPRLGLCVLGGLFSEGIDLPGNQLIGVAIVGMGLPVPSLRVNAIRACYQAHFGDGFGYACRIPGMQKVLQAAGRVIRSDTDKGMVLLLDERYQQAEYQSLLPREWNIYDNDLDAAVKQLEEEV